MKTIALAFATVSCLTLVSLSGRGAVITVDCKGGGDYLTIQQAVDAAATSDTILVAPCVYEEQVEVAEKELVFEGAGAEVTILRWENDDSWHGTLHVDPMPQWGGLTVRSMSVIREPDSRRAIYWDENSLRLEDCRVTGAVAGGHYYGAVFIYDSAVTSVGVQGGQRTSIVEGSRIGHMGISGVQFGGPSGLESTGNYYGTLQAGACMSIYSVSDSIGTALIPGGIDVGNDLNAEESHFDHLMAARSPYIVISCCDIVDLTYSIDWALETLSMQVTNCLVDGNVVIEPDWKDEGRSSYRKPHGGERIWQLAFQHNTVLGNLLFDGATTPVWVEDSIRSNIILGETTITTSDAMLVTHNDFVGGATISVPGDSVFANICAPPFFCDPALGDYTIGDCSECVGAAHDGGNIGAFDIGCVCTAVEARSWGEIKSLFR